MANRNNKNKPGMNIGKQSSSSVLLTDRFKELFASIDKANKALKRSIESSSTKSNKNKVAIKTTPPTPKLSTETFNNLFNPPDSQTVENSSLKQLDRSRHDDTPSLPSHEETHDRTQENELFFIFIEQLRENINQLENFTDSLVKRSGKSHLLNRCSEIIASLHFSACYMGYDKLTFFYGHWIAEIEATVKDHTDGKMVSFDFMKKNISTVHEIFPEIKAVSANDPSNNTNPQLQHVSQSTSLKNRFDTLLKNFAPPSSHSAEQTSGNSFRSGVNSGENSISTRYDSEQNDLSANDKDPYDGGEFQNEQDALSETDLHRQELFEKLSNDLLSLANDLNVSIQEDEYPDDILVVLQDEIEHEDYDEEDFSQYLEQIKAELPRLIQSIQDVQSERYNELLYKQCITSIKKLCSSCGEMGFVEQNNFYNQWMEDISNSKDEVSDGLPVVLDYMQDNLEIIRNLFSDFFEIPTQIQPQGDRQKSQSAESLSPCSQHFTNNIISPSEDPQLFTRLSNALDEEFDKPQHAEQESSPENDEKLFEKLSYSLENNFIGRKTTGLKSTNEVINKILKGAGLNDEQAITQPPENDPESTIIDLENPIIKDHVESAQDAPVKTNAPKSYQDTSVSKPAPATTSQKGSDDLPLSLNGKNWLKYADNALEQVANEIEDSKEAEIIPLSKLYSVYQKLINNLIEKTGKNIQFTITGDEIELDKKILEEISGPLIQVIRNCIDHGIERNQERKLSGKNNSATLLFETRQINNTAIIEISDDGKGIDPLLIKKRAKEAQLLPEDELNSMGDPEILRLIMTPGFSTDKKTKPASRGAGLDIVFESIKNINGVIDIESRVGSGTLTRIKIPLALSVTRVLDIKVGDRLFSIPRSFVEETMRISKESVISKDGMEYLEHEGSPLPLINLAGIFNDHYAITDSPLVCIIVVNTMVQRAGLIVDDFLPQPVKARIKSLAQHLQTGNCFSGVSINNGATSLLLDIENLIPKTGILQVSDNE